MLKKGVKGLIVIAILILLVAVGIHKYIQSTTAFEYAELPDDSIPKQYEKVTYTIPTIDEQGHAHSQTFTINNEDVTSNIVKLTVRNDKVKSHEFIEEKDIPQKVKDKMKAGSF